MNWIEVAVKTTSEGTDAVAEVFYQAGINGVVIEDPYDIELFKGEKSDWDYVDETLAYDEDEVVVKGYLADNPSFHDSIQIIKDRLKWLLSHDLGIDIGSVTLELTNVKEEDWANNWKKYFKPKKVGSRIVIKPSWEQYSPEEGDLVLELDPGMAFGTGTHETTILCVQALENYIDPTTKLLDIGCGTGILAIAGLLLGAKNAIAVDLDLDAVRISRENAQRNHVHDNIQVIHGDLMDKVEGRFDVVVANIIADAIIKMSKDIKRYLTANGVFIASGIILDRIEDVKRAINEAGLSIIDIETMGEWAVVVSHYE
ncbi:MAG: 50S ribosomal protein L11 methyltransferase [Clostridiales bacterium]|nr:50S ribosomal protein L11 methyltransferase [Clostridiales bacterium]